MSPAKSRLFLSMCRRREAKDSVDYWGNVSVGKGARVVPGGKVCQKNLFLFGLQSFKGLKSSAAFVAEGVRHTFLYTKGQLTTFL